MRNNKRAQVGEFLTWIIATIVLIAVLIIFIYVSSVLSVTKYLKANLSDDSEESVDWVTSKTQFAYTISSMNKNRIQGWISEEDEGG
jgi:uncharacterized protein YpmB